LKHLGGDLKDTFNIEMNNENKPVKSTYSFWHAFGIEFYSVIDLVFVRFSEIFFPIYP